MGAFASKAKVLRGLLVPRALFALGISCWSVLALVYALRPAGSAASGLVLELASWTAQIFAGVALFVLFFARGGSWRLPLLFGAAVLARYAGDLVWTGVPMAGVEFTRVPQVVTAVLSYALLFGVLISLGRPVRREMLLVSALDAIAVVLVSGAWLWSLLAGARTAGYLPGGWGSFLALAQPALDLGLLALGLSALLTARRRLSFPVLVVGGVLFSRPTGRTCSRCRAGRRARSKDGR